MKYHHCMIVITICIHDRIGSASCYSFGSAVEVCLDLLLVFYHSGN